DSMPLPIIERERVTFETVANREAQAGGGIQSSAQQANGFQYVTIACEPMWRAKSAQPSRTSILVAAARAFGAHDPDPSVRNPDWLAERFVGPDELELLGDHPMRAALQQ